MNSKASIIVIDDEESILEILEDYLSEKKYDVYKVSNGRKAHAILKDIKCDVALIDLKLPDCSGLDLVEEFNKIYPNMKCIIITAFASVESTISALRLNVFDYIQKPFDILRIGEAVEAACNNNLLIRENAMIINKLQKANRELEDSRTRLNRKVLTTNEQLARANESLKRHVTRLKMLYHLGRDISSNENWDDALDRFLMALCKYLQADGAGILLFSNEGTSLKPRAYYQVTDKFLDTALRKLLKAQEMDLLQQEIFCLESCDKRIDTCLAAEKAWNNTVIPLLFKGRWLGFLILKKKYASRIDYLNDYHFINTMQTIFTEEVANAVNISRLRKLKDFNKTILENINSGVLKTDKHGKIIFLNRCARKIIGEDASSKLYFNDLFKYDDKNKDLFMELVSSGRENFSFEDILRIDPDEQIPVKVETTLVETDDFSGKSLVTVFEDLSEQKAIERELRKADRLRSLGELSAGVAHEIRNPLTGIATTAQLLNDKLKGDKEKKKYLDVILGEINRLDNIIKNLLDYSRPSKLKLAEISLEKIVQSSIVLLKKKADKYGVNFKIKKSIKDDRCVVDKDQIKQVVLNLSSNAIQACQAGGELNVEIRSSSKSGFLRIDFKDNGEGVSEKTADKIYNPFFTTNSDGSGLGLPISKKIIENHKGTIYYRNNKDKGTTFTVELPGKNKTADK